MEEDDVSKTLAEVGRRLESEGKEVTQQGTYLPSALLRALDVDLVPTLTISDATAADTPAAKEGGRLPASMGRFRLDREIGRGGMGRVYEARDPELRRPVAVKCFLDPKVVTSQQLGRFVAEAQITAQLEHPNIVPIYDMGVTLEGQLYFVMRRVYGRSLREIIALLGGREDGTPAPREVDLEWSRNRLLRAFGQACHAVAYAHERGVVHRDLKPSNVMLGDFGEVLVMDWGIAKLIEPRQKRPVDRVKVGRTEWGRPIGTRGYMSPEQLLGQHADIDERSDVWSLGAILYEVITLQRAFQGRDEEITEQVLTGKVVDPRVRAVRRSVPDELAEVALKALSADPAQRYRTAGELASAVESYLEGSKRRAAAEEHTNEAAALFREYEALEQEGVHLEQLRRQHEARLAPWAPLSEKRDLLALRERLEELEAQRVDTFGLVVRGCERALEQDPANVDARSLLAQAYATRLVEAEQRRDRAQQRYYESRVLAYDNGSLSTFLKGTGTLTLDTDPSGAEVVCQRVEQRGLVWSLSQEVSLGTTPLHRLPLDMGSYRLTFRASGKRDTVYPVHITRGRSWSFGPQPIPLYSDAEIGAEFVYVPAGPCLVGGDPAAPSGLQREEIWVPGFFISVVPVTMDAYCAFINAIHEADPSEAWARVPRASATPTAGTGQYWAPPGSRGYVVPEVDEDGDRWSSSWPAASISWDDAVAYAAWRSAVSGVHFELPREIWWEKAARGVDGRAFPWGDDFDPLLCKMRRSRPGRPLPEPVGTFSMDSSIYGVRDTAGSVSEWCGDTSFDGIAELRVARGGSWHDEMGYCRLAHRHNFERWSVKFQVGFRLARPCS